MQLSTLVLDTVVKLTFKFFIQITWLAFAFIQARGLQVYYIAARLGDTQFDSLVTKYNFMVGCSMRVCAHMFLHLIFSGN